MISTSNYNIATCLQAAHFPPQVACNDEIFQYGRPLTARDNSDSNHGGAISIGGNNPSHDAQLLRNELRTVESGQHLFKSQIENSLERHLNFDFCG